MSYYTNTNSRSYTDARVKDLYLDGTIIPGIPIPVIQPLINYSNVDPNNGLVDINGLTRDFGDLNAPRLEIGNPAQGQGEGYYYKQNNNYEEKISAPGGDKLINLESLDETYATAVISSAGTDYTIRAVEDVVIESTGNPGSVTISAGVNPGDVSNVRLISTRDTTINAARDVGIEAGETLEAFSNQEVLITALDNIDIEARGNAGFAQISHTIAPNSSFLQLKVNDTSVLSAFDDLDILQGENSINMNGVTLNIERETANTIFKVAMDNASVLMEASDKATSKRGTVEVADDFISNQVTNAGADISRVELEPGIFRADLPIAGSPGGIINSLNTTLPTPTSSLVVASALTNNSSFTVTPDKLELNSNYGGVNRQFRIENGQYYMTNAPVAAQTHAVGINQLTGELTIVDNNFQSLSLVGNPIHAFANTSGNLIYRGMTSPDGSINLSVDANNINLSVASPASSPFSIANISGTTLATGTTGSLGGVTIPSNTLTASSQSFRYVTYGTMAANSSGGGLNAIAFQINGTTVGTTCTLPSNISSTGSYRMEVYLIAVSYAPAAVSYSCSISFDYEQVLPLASTTSHTQSFLVSGINMGVPCTFRTYVTVMNPNTSISSNCAKCWLE